MNIFVSDAADADLLRIYSYLAERNPDAAVSVLRDINDKFVNLCRFPFIGRERASLGSGVRSLVSEPYVIFYAVERDRVTIVRVLDGRRDIDAEFQR
jgi:toxin ParE1/3/4